MKLSENVSLSGPWMFGKGEEDAMQKHFFFYRPFSPSHAENPSCLDQS